MDRYGIPELSFRDEEKRKKAMMDRAKLNEEAWAIFNTARQGARGTKEKLSAKNRDFENFKRNERAREKQRLDGSQGAASPCKRIDPKTGDVIEVVKRKARSLG